LRLAESPDRSVLFCSFDDADELAVHRVGGKFAALAELARSGHRVPRAICIGACAYDRFVDETGLRDRIELELRRKSFDEMRWEEVWDAALRIRNLFLRTEPPMDLLKGIAAAVTETFGASPVAVRSSAPWEDSAGSSFAGLHESYVNVRCPDAVARHVRLVWASLWSDRALLYRREVGLDTQSSSMAVVIQEMIAGDSSGVVFSQSPTDPACSVIEAVHGLNQGLVDGAVEPDRWVLDRETGTVRSRTEPDRSHAMRPAPDGVRLVSLPAALRRKPPISEREAARVFRLASGAEAHFGTPQDVEWTLAGRRLFTLQSRPITTLQDGRDDDQRPWYLSLTRTFENLRRLRTRVEDEIIPEMVREAEELATQELAALPTDALVAEQKRRAARVAHWREVYREDLIPFAHGVRLFGQVYNDRLSPDDAYEFVLLLRGAGLESVDRDRELRSLGRTLSNQLEAVERLRIGRPKPDDAPLVDELDRFDERHSDIACLIPDPAERRIELIRLALAASSAGPRRQRPAVSVQELEHRFLASFGEDEHAFAEELLDLARVSHRMRDNDNLYLGRIEAQELAARNEIDRRMRNGRAAADLREGVSDAAGPSTRADGAGDGFHTLPRSPRQIVGQPAGPGFARGVARVIEDPSELFEFQPGEVLVCDAIDPKMTLVAQLAAAIVERRGGMLIHGAIIAREYGLPCVTGVPKATRRIRTGEALAVDGYLGIVTIEH
jgi:pyruvate,water dikinase